jgi:hypothetical protein
MNQLDWPAPAPCPSISVMPARFFGDAAYNVAVTL